MALPTDHLARPGRAEASQSRKTPRRRSRLAPWQDDEPDPSHDEGCARDHAEGQGFVEEDGPYGDGDDGGEVGDQAEVGGGEVLE